MRVSDASVRSFQFCLVSKDKTRALYRRQHISLPHTVIRPHPPARPRPSLSSKELSYSSPAMKGGQEVVELLVVPPPLPGHLCISHHEELGEDIHL